MGLKLNTQSSHSRLVVVLFITVTCTINCIFLPQWIDAAKRRVPEKKRKDESVFTKCPRTVTPRGARYMVTGAMCIHQELGYSQTCCPDHMFTLASRCELCDVCPRAYCPTLNHARYIWGDAENALIQSQIAMPSRRFFAFNPTFLRHNVILLRISNHSMCLRHELPPVNVHQPALSKLRVCSTDGSWNIGNLICETYDIDISSFQTIGHEGETFHLDQVFIGPEDVRALHMDSMTLFVFFTINIKVVGNHGILAHQISRVAVGYLDTTSHLIRESVILRKENEHYQRNEKNWLPFTWRNKICIVTSGNPVVIRQVNAVSGLTSFLGSDSELSIPTAAAGASPLSLDGDTYVTLLHYHQYHGFGRVYNHVLMVFTMSVFGPTINWISPPFRLSPPSLSHNVQYGSGMTFSSSYLVIAYGEADCATYLLETPFTAMYLLNKKNSLSRLYDAYDTKYFVHDNNLESRLSLRLFGPLRTTEGFATVNRELALNLLIQASACVNVDVFDTSHYIMFPDFTGTRHAPLEDVIVQSDFVHNKELDVFLHNKWPVQWDLLHSIERRCKVLLLFAWEFTVIPNTWVLHIMSSVTHVFAPSTFTQQSFVRSGIPSSKVTVLPHGSEFQSDISHQTCRVEDVNGQTVLTFHGGALWRKGITFLFDGFERAFDPEDTVSLILLVTYGDKEVFREIDTRVKHARRKGHHIIYIHDRLQEVDSIYACTDVLVQPYRAEGFGLTSLEAMQRGIPVVAPNMGASCDFMNASNAFIVDTYLVACTVWPCGKNTLFELETPEQPQWNHIRLSSLAVSMKQAAFHEHTRLRKGHLARQSSSWWSWKSTVSTLLDSLVHEGLLGNISKFRDATTQRTSCAK